MQFISFRVLFRRIKAISSMMKDRSVPKRKKALVIFGILYLFMPLDLIPPFGFLDDLILWIWILFHLKDTLDRYRQEEPAEDLSGRFRKEDIVDGVSFTVEQVEKHE